MSEARMNEEARVSLTHREGIARSSPRHCGYCNVRNYRLACAGKQRGDDYRTILGVKANEHVLIDIVDVENFNHLLKCDTHIY